VKETLKYLVYRFGADEKINLGNADKIIALTSSKKFMDAEGGKNDYRYVVTALDRLWNESEQSNIVSPQVQ